MSYKVFREFLRDEDGASTILGIFWFMLFVGIGGLAVDVTDAYRVQTMMQATADASAHAAVIDLPDEAAAATATALDYAESNMPSAQYGTVLAASDVEIGVWWPIGRTFVAGAPSPNAVRVTLRSTAATGNPLPTNFLRIIGLQEWNISVYAVAAYSKTGSCYDEYGFIAAGYIHSGSENDYYGVCIHAENYVKVGSTNNFYDDTQVSMPETDDLLEGGDNYQLHPEPPEGSLFKQSLYPPLLGSVPGILSGLAPGANPAVTPPNFLQNTVLLTDEELPSTLKPGTMYVVSGGKEPVIPSDAVVNNVGIVYLNPDKPIIVGSKVTLTNVFLAARGSILVGSENQIGATNFCVTGQGGVFIIAEGNYDAGTRTQYTGVQILTLGDAKIGSELTSGGVGPEALSVQAGGDIYWGSQEIFRSGCPAPSFFALNGRLAIVD